MKKLKPYLLLTILIIISALLRFIRIGQTPEGFTPDELGYVYNAYSIAKTGNNIYGQHLPLITNLGVPFMPTTTYLLVPYLYIVGIAPYAARALHAFLGVAEVVLLYFIVLNLFKSRTLAFISGLMLAISPWHLQFTRVAYDNVISLFLYLTGILLFLQSLRKKFSILWSLIPFFLAVFSFRAMSVIFLPVIISLLWYGFPILKSRVKELIVYLLGVVVIIGSFFLISSFEGKGYTREAFQSSNSPFDETTAQKEVDIELKQSESPLVISRIFSNKPLYAIRKMRENYLGFFSPQFLFTHGDAQPLYSLWWRGMLYIIELPLIIIGCFYLYKVNKRSSIFVFLSLLIAPLPSLFAGPPYGSRTFYAVAFLSILSAAGLLYLYNSYKKMKPVWIKKIVAIAFIVIFIFQIASYLFQYHSRYRTYAAESWFKSHKDIASYIKETESSYNRVIIGKVDVYDVVEYAFWSQTDPLLVQNALAKYVPGSREPITLGNITFLHDCLIGTPTQLTTSYTDKRTLYITREECPGSKELQLHSIQEKGSIRTLWRIYDVNEETIPFFSTPSAYLQ